MPNGENWANILPSICIARTNWKRAQTAGLNFTRYIPSYKGLVVGMNSFQDSIVHCYRWVALWHRTVLMPIFVFQSAARQENKSSNCAYDASHVSSPKDKATSQDLSPTSTILTVGGLNPTEVCGSRISRWIHEYDPVRNNWAALATLPDKRHHQGAILLDMGLYIIGKSM